MLQPGDQGIDVSRWQHPNNAAINYDAVAASGRKFAYIEATDGTTSINSYVSVDAKGFLAAGMEVGLYQFFRPDQNTDEQLSDFVKVAQACPGWTLPVMIDVETEAAEGWATLAKLIGDFRSNLITALHCEVGYYWNLNFADNLSGSPWGAPVWLADPSHPNAPSKPCLLQQTGEGPVPGIEGNVDLDVWRTPYGSAPVPQPTEDDMQPMLLTNSAGTGFLVVNNTKVGLPDPTLNNHIPGLVVVPKGDVSDAVIDAFPNA